MIYKDLRDAIRILETAKAQVWEEMTYRYNSPAMFTLLHAKQDLEQAIWCLVLREKTMSRSATN